MTAPAKILIMGLPGSGKTTLARAVARLMPDSVHFDADEVRKMFGRVRSFSAEARIEQACRMAALCDLANGEGRHAIADFVCPTPETREAFCPAFTVWVDRIAAGRFEDTNQLFVPPADYNIRVTAKGTAEAWADEVISAWAGHRTK